MLRLRRDGTRLDSARGIQLGDPPGPALFAMAIREHITRARAEVIEQFPNLPGGGLDMVGFHLDDGAVAGDAGAVKLFCDKLRVSLGMWEYSSARKNRRSCQRSGIIETMRSY